MVTLWPREHAAQRIEVGKRVGGGYARAEEKVQVGVVVVVVRDRGPREQNEREDDAPHITATVQYIEARPQAGRHVWLPNATQ